MNVTITKVNKTTKIWGLWTIEGYYTGGVFSGKVSEEIYGSINGQLTVSKHAELGLSKDNVLERNNEDGDNWLEKNISIDSQNKFGKSGMESWNAAWDDSYQYGGAAVVISYTFGERTVELVGLNTLYRTIG